MPAVGKRNDGEDSTGVRLMRLMHKHGPLTLMELARRQESVGIDMMKTSITRELHNLRERGLVVLLDYAPSPYGGRPKARYYLTEEGKKCFDSGS